MNDKEMQWSFVAPQREDMPAIQAYKEEFETHHQLLHGTSDSTELETAMAAVPNRTFLLKDGEGEIVSWIESLPVRAGRSYWLQHPPCKAEAGLWKDPAFPAFVRGFLCRDGKGADCMQKG